MRRYIYFGKLSVKLWFIIFTALFYSIRNLFTFEESFKEQFSKNPFLDIFAKQTGKAFHLVLYFIFAEKEHRNNKNITYKGEENESNFHKLIVPGWVFLMGFCNLMISIIVVKNSEDSIEYNVCLGVNIILIAIFSKLLLHKKHHRHHLLGLLVFFKGLIVKIVSK